MPYVYVLTAHATRDPDRALSRSSLGRQLATPGSLADEVVERVQVDPRDGDALRFVVFMLLVPRLPLDTSEAGRIFSLMNDIKTYARTRLQQQNLNAMMVWNYYGNKLEPHSKCQCMKSSRSCMLLPITPPKGAIHTSRPHR